jgi:hypothetical protein
MSSDTARQGIEEPLGHRDGCILESTPDKRRLAVDGRKG